MGFVVIMPFGALAGWIIVRIFLWLRRGGFGPEWWRAYAVLTAAGLLLGTWFAFFTRYTVANRRLAGFPIPLEISSREKPDAPWTKAELPPPVRAGAIVTDVLAGGALCLAPLAVAAFIKENRGKKDFAGGRAAEKDNQSV